MASHYLCKLFEPESIAVIGASHRPTSVGTRVFNNLLHGHFKGYLYAVNPKYKKVQGQTCYHAIEAIKETIDLAVIATPANTIPSILTECGKKGIQHAVILSSGFSEAGKVGRSLEQHILNVAKGYHIRIVGPNCLGIMRPKVNMNATFDNTDVLKGSIAFVSQSGALSAGILDWAINKNIGFSAVVALGNSVDVDFADTLDYLAVDPETQSILLYIEGIHNARRFMSALRASARMKPVIAIKAGRKNLGSRAALSHTGALMGDDDVFDTVLKRAGVVRVMTIEELFLAASILSSNHKVYGNRLTIVTNGGGAGVMAADCASDLNIELPGLNETIKQQLNKVLPTQWSRQNPIDIIGDATPERYHATLDIVKTESTDGLLTMLVPVAMVQPIKVAEQIIKDANDLNKPLIACWMGGNQVETSWDLFAKHHIPCFDTPEKAVQAFSFLSAHYLNQQLLLQVPEPLSPQPKPDMASARAIISNAMEEGRSVLTAIESKNILKAFSIPVIPTEAVSTKEELLKAVKQLGFPLVMKINSPDITHKKDVGGIVLNILDQNDALSAFDNLIAHIKKVVPTAAIHGVTLEPMLSNPNDRELLIGVMRDVVFGPVIVFGAGGTLVEIIKDRALALPPLNNFIVKQLISETKISKLLGAFRHMQPVDMNHIVNTLLRVSEMICEFACIKELDINPFIVNDQNAYVVDARIVIDHEMKAVAHFSHMAIHPYPNHLTQTHELKNGKTITMRPIRPEDAYITQEFFRNLSSESKYFRFMQHIRELTPKALVRLTQIDYDREMTFIVTHIEKNEEKAIAVGHYITNPDREGCEFAIAVADEWQNQGVGSKLMKYLIKQAKAQGLNVMIGAVIATNKPMLDMTQHLGFVVGKSDDPTIKIVTKYI